MAKTIGLVLGVVFLAVGLLGMLVANPLVGPGALFETNTLHDLVHLATGLLFVLVALFAESSMAMFMKIFGVVYLLVAVLGFLSGGMILGLIAANTADHLLHVVLGVVILGLGWKLGQGNGMGGMSSGMGGGMTA